MPNADGTGEDETMEGNSEDAETQTMDAELDKLLSADTPIEGIGQQIAAHCFKVKNAFPVNPVNVATGRKRTVLTGPKDKIPEKIGFKEYIVQTGTKLVSVGEQVTYVTGQNETPTGPQPALSGALLIDKCLQNGQLMAVVCLQQQVLHPDGAPTDVGRVKYQDLCGIPVYPAGAALFDARHQRIDKGNFMETKRGSGMPYTTGTVHDFDLSTGYVYLLIFPPTPTNTCPYVALHRRVLVRIRDLRENMRMNEMKFWSRFSAAIKGAAEFAQLNCSFSVEDLNSDQSDERQRLMDRNTQQLHKDATQIQLLILAAKRYCSNHVVDQAMAELEEFKFTYIYKFDTPRVNTNTESTHTSDESLPIVTSTPAREICDSLIGVEAQNTSETEDFSAKVREMNEVLNAAANLMLLCDGDEQRDIIIKEATRQCIAMLMESMLSGRSVISIPEPVANEYEKMMEQQRQMAFSEGDGFNDRSLQDISDRQVREIRQQSIISSLRSAPRRSGDEPGCSTDYTPESAFSDKNQSHSSSTEGPPQERPHSQPNNRRAQEAVESTTPSSPDSNSTPKTTLCLLNTETGWRTISKQVQPNERVSTAVEGSGCEQHVRPATEVVSAAARPASGRQSQQDSQGEPKCPRRKSNTDPRFILPKDFWSKLQLVNPLSGSLIESLQNTNLSRLAGSRSLQPIALRAVLPVAGTPLPVPSTPRIDAPLCIDSPSESTPNQTEAPAVNPKADEDKAPEDSSETHTPDPTHTEVRTEEQEQKLEMAIDQEKTAVKLGQKRQAPAAETQQQPKVARVVPWAAPTFQHRRVRQVRLGLTPERGHGNTRPIVTAASPLASTRRQRSTRESGVIIGGALQAMQRAIRQAAQLSNNPALSSGQRAPGQTIPTVVSHNPGTGQHGDQSQDTTQSPAVITALSPAVTVAAAVRRPLGERQLTGGRLDSPVSQSGVSRYTFGANVDRNLGSARVTDVTVRNDMSFSPMAEWFEAHRTALVGPAEHPFGTMGTITTRLSQNAYLVVGVARFSGELYFHVMGVNNFEERIVRRTVFAPLTRTATSSRVHASSGPASGTAIICPGDRIRLRRAAQPPLDATYFCCASGSQSLVVRLGDDHIWVFRRVPTEDVEWEANGPFGNLRDGRNTPMPCCRMGIRARPMGPRQ